MVAFTVKPAKKDTCQDQFLGKTFQTDTLSLAVESYKMRIEELSKKENIKYVFVFKNKGKDAGTSIAHTHTQIAATSLVPTIIQKEESAINLSYEDFLYKISTMREYLSTEAEGRRAQLLLEAILN